MRKPKLDAEIVRKDKIGFVFQDYYLIDHLTSCQNVMLPGLMGDSLGRKKNREKGKRINVFVERVSLSIGIQMLYRGRETEGLYCGAFFKSPEIILADEPTGSLDAKNSDVVIRLLINTAKAQGTTLVLATHSKNVAQRCRKYLLFIQRY